MAIRYYTPALAIFSYNREVREDIEIVLDLRRERSKPLPPRFRHYRAPYTITKAQMGRTIIRAQMGRP